MIDPRVKIRHLQSFLEVARHKSVMRAAEHLHVSQPAVTKTLRELEEVLGVALVEREGRGIRLSRQGEVFLRYAAATLAAFSRALESVSGATGGSEPVRVGALPTVSVRIMPKAMALFLKENTMSPVKIVTGENAVLIEQLKAGSLDMVIGRLAQPEKMTGLSFEHLYSEDVRFIVRPGHPLTRERVNLLSRLGEYPVLMPTRHSVIRPIVDHFLIMHGVPSPPVEIETVSDSFGRAFLRDSDAVWIISEGVVADDLKLGTLAALALDTGDTRGPVGLTMRSDHVPSLPFSLLTQAIKTVAATLNVPG